MKVTVKVAVDVTPTVNHYYSFIYESFEVEPVKIIRTSVGTVGAARNRYYYQILFVGLDGMIDFNQKSLSGRKTTGNVNRRLNPKWKPPVDGWDGNVWTKEGYGE